MARGYFINGQCMVYVKGNQSSAISSLTELGLSDSQIRITPNFRYQDIQVNAYGAGMVPPEVQYFCGDATISMNLVHFDRTVLSTCLRESQAGTTSEGQLNTTGITLGGASARFTGSNHYIGLNLSSPIGSPWRFLFTYLVGPPVEFPLGTERSIVQLNWRAIPYVADPWVNGVCSLDSYVWDHVLDT